MQPHACHDTIFNMSVIRLVKSVSETPAIMFFRTISMRFSTCSGMFIIPRIRDLVAVRHFLLHHGLADASY
jgi:hypothetical protein